MKSSVTSKLVNSRRGCSNIDSGHAMDCEAMLASSVLTALYKTNADSEIGLFRSSGAEQLGNVTLCDSGFPQYLDRVLTEPWDHASDTAGGF